MRDHCGNSTLRGLENCLLAKYFKNCITKNLKTSNCHFTVDQGEHESPKVAPPCMAILAAQGFAIRDSRGPVLHHLEAMLLPRSFFLHLPPK